MDSLDSLRMASLLSGFTWGRIHVRAGGGDRGGQDTCRPWKLESVKGSWEQSDREVLTVTHAALLWPPSRPLLPPLQGVGSHVHGLYGHTSVGP